MRYRNAEPQRPDVSDVGDLVPQFPQDLRSTSVITRIDPVQRSTVIVPALPLKAAERHIIGNTEVVERNQ